MVEAMISSSPTQSQWYLTCRGVSRVDGGQKERARRVVPFTAVVASDHVSGGSVGFPTCAIDGFWGKHGGLGGPGLPTGIGHG